jgi:adenylate kinase
MASLVIGFVTKAGIAQAASARRTQIPRLARPVTVVTRRPRCGGLSGACGSGSFPRTQRRAARLVGPLKRSAVPTQDTMNEPEILPSPSFRPPAVILVGPPGAGKGTQGRVLGMIPGFVHWEAGRVLRDLDPETEIGRRTRTILARGDLLDDDTVVAVFRESVFARRREVDGPSPVLVLDGIPRTTGQAIRLTKLVDVFVVLHLVAHDPDRLVTRLALRARQEGRADDESEAIVRHRFEVYRRETEPVLREFDPGIVVEVDAMREPVVVAHEVLGHIVGRQHRRNIAARQAV